jgi:putative MATE family efflux protein
VDTERDNAAKDPSSPGPVIPPLDPETLDPSQEPVLAPDRSSRRARAADFGLTPDGRLRSGQLAGMSMGTAIWVLAWPVLIDSLLNSFVGLTDTVLSAGVSAAATDAIGNASYMIWFLGLVVLALDVGATALVSRSVGAGRLAVAGAAVAQTMLMAVLAGLGLGGALAVCAGPIASAMPMNAEASAAFTDYLRVISLDVPLMAVLYAAIACVRGVGDTFGPMRAMVVVNVVNIGASWALAGIDLKTASLVDGQMVTRTVLANPFPFRMGVSGIALGTVLGHLVGVWMMVPALIRGVAGVRLRWRRMYPHWHTMRRLLRVGLPNFAETLGMWVGNFLVVLMVGWLGEGLVGAHIMAVRIEAFSFQPGFAVGMAAATLAGQYLGAGSPRLAKRGVRRCAVLAAVIMGLMGVVFIAAPRFIVGLMSSQEAHLAATPRLLLVAGMVQVPFALAIVLRSALRGAGDVKVVMWLTWATTYAVRLPLAYALSGVDIPLPGGGVIRNPFPFGWGLTGLWIGLCGEMVIRGGVFTARFAHGGWARSRV